MHDIHAPYYIVVFLRNGQINQFMKFNFVGPLCGAVVLPLSLTDSSSETTAITVAAKDEDEQEWPCATIEQPIPWLEKELRVEQ